MATYADYNNCLPEFRYTEEGHTVYLGGDSLDAYCAYENTYGAPSIEWCKENLGVEPVEFEEGFTPGDLINTVACTNGEPYNVDDAYGWADIAMSVAKYGVKTIKLEDVENDEDDLEDYVTRAERLDFSEDNLPEAIHKSGIYTFAWF